MGDNGSKEPVIALDEKPQEIGAQPANRRKLIQLDIDDSGQVFVDAPLDTCRELCYEALANAQRLVFYHKPKAQAPVKRDIKHDLLNFVRGKR